jgi:adenosylmethionine-8-amino-7-oxononanoate aminotransferase
MIKGLLHSMTVCPDYDSDYPTMEYGKGVFLYDSTGKKYIDACSGKAAASCLGHGVKEIYTAMYDQAGKLSVFPSHTFTSQVVEDYLAKLLSFAPPNYERAWITTGGTEAVENAVKLALQYHFLSGNPGRFKIIGRDGSYHGNSLLTLDIGGMEYRKKMYEKGMYHYPHIAAAHSYRKPAGMSLEEYSKHCSDELESTILREGPETVAAFVFEPVVAAALGAVPPPNESYLSEIRRICSKYGVLLIADEVLTGFGRLGTNFGVELWGIEPDIIACGKGMSAGYYPMGGILAHRNISALLEKLKSPFISGSTFTCNPVAAATGIAVIDYFTGNNVVPHASDMSKLLLSSLQDLYKYPNVGDIRGEGLLIGIEFVKNQQTREPLPEPGKMAGYMLSQCIDSGVIFYPAKGDVLLIMPPLIIQEQEILQISQTLDRVLSQASPQ